MTWGYGTPAKNSFHDKRRVSSDLAEAVKRSNISFICLSSTVRTGGFDSSDVEEVYSRIIEISKVFTHPPFPNDYIR